MIHTEMEDLLPLMTNLNNEFKHSNKPDPLDEAIEAVNASIHKTIEEIYQIKKAEMSTEPKKTNKKKNTRDTNFYHTINNFLKSKPKNQRNAPPPPLTQPKAQPEQSRQPPHKANWQHNRVDIGK
jgi:hypothetical protein